jgi:hypothetical protein
MHPGSPQEAAKARTAESLAAAYDAFAGMLADLHDTAARAGGLTAAFVTAAAAAADGRDAVAMAPSTPPGDAEALPSRFRGADPPEIADAIAQEARLLGARLAMATPAASQPGDRDALAVASRHADAMYACLTGTG